MVSREIRYPRWDSDRDDGFTGSLPKRSSSSSSRGTGNVLQWPNIRCLSIYDENFFRNWIAIHKRRENKSLLEGKLLFIHIFKISSITLHASTRFIIIQLYQIARMQNYVDKQFILDYDPILIRF